MMNCGRSRLHEPQSLRRLPPEVFLLHLDWEVRIQNRGQEI